MEELILNLQLFGDAETVYTGAGSLVNATGNYVNAYTGATENFASPNTLSPTMKTYYDTELLENARDTLVYAQLGKKQTLPAHRGKVVEWRKWNTLPDLGKLTEGVIPTGKKLGMTSMTVEISQYGDYVAITDQLDLHAVDNAILGATEELGAAGGRTYDKLVRNVLKGNTTVLYADEYNAGAFVSTPASRTALKAAAITNSHQCYLTPDMVAKAVRVLRTNNAPYYEGNNYVCVIHPSLTYDLRKSSDWVEAHKYASPEQIYNGEIGSLHGVRFIETNLCPVWKDAASDTAVFYTAMVFGKDAFGVVDPAGAGMESIIKDKSQVGGPLEQFSTVGTKMSMATKILYPERMVCIECNSSYSGTDTTN